MDYKIINSVKTATVRNTIIGNVQITEHDDFDFNGPYLSVEVGGEVVLDNFLYIRLDDVTEDIIRDELDYIYR